MAAIAGLNATARQPSDAGRVISADSVASGELAKLETQLSDWIHCPSCKTSAGKAKIAEITAKIDAIKAQDGRADEPRHARPSDAVATDLTQRSLPRVRFDGVGAMLNLQA